jgi:hypothetical protein
VTPPSERPDQAKRSEASDHYPSPPEGPIKGIKGTLEGSIQEASPC